MSDVGTGGVAADAVSARRRWEDAVAGYRKILEKDPRNVEALHRLACLHAAAGDNKTAEALIRMALGVQPDYVEAIVDLGVVLRRLGRLGEAVEAYRDALKREPDNVGALYNCANALKSVGKAEEAEDLYRRVLVEQAEHVGALNNLGLACHDLGKYDDALDCYRKGLKVAPDNPELHNNLGNALKGLEREEDAIACYRRAVHLRPTYADAHANLAVVSQVLGRPRDAADAFRRASELDPDNPEFPNGLGTALIECLDLPGAEEAFRRSAAAGTDYAEAHWNLANLLLLTGRFEDGWAEYEWRFRCPGLSAYGRKFDAPRWDGSKLDGDRVFVSIEQGFGDVLQFARFLPEIERRGGVPILETPPELFSLLGMTFGPTRLVPRGSIPRDCAYHVPLMSLPHVLKVGDRIPADAPYIKAPQASLVDLDESGGLKAGLVWAGRPTHKNDRNRSIPLECFTGLLETEGCVFHALQVGDRRADIARLDLGGRMRDLGPELTDFAVTASVIEGLDLVVTADTAVAHLAGALGRPVWTLLPHVPDWRWMLDREDSPWYPAMRLFRQKTAGDWEGVFAEVAAAIGEFVPSA